MARKKKYKKVIDEGKILSLINKENGYKYITLVKDGTRKNHYIHRLVAQAFIGNIPAGLVVNHIDHNKGNNCVDNLEIITQMQNTHHSLHLMKKPKTHKDDNFYIRLKGKRYEVTVNRKYLGIFATIEQARKVRDEYIKKNQLLLMIWNTALFVGAVLLKHIIFVTEVQTENLQININLL